MKTYTFNVTHWLAKGEAQDSDHSRDGTTNGHCGSRSDWELLQVLFDPGRKLWLVSIYCFAVQIAAEGKIYRKGVIMHSLALNPTIMQISYS